MKAPLLILTDLWGIDNSIWINHYLRLLEDTFEIQVLDSPRLGGIDPAGFQETEIHQKMVHRGIDNAVNRLASSNTLNPIILAFSVGGVIAWKAALQGFHIDTLFAISATRLRYEQIKPKCQVKLYFGELDKFKPEPDWFEYLKIDNTIFSNAHHQCYTELNFVKEICGDLKTHQNMR